MPLEIEPEGPCWDALQEALAAAWDAFDAENTAAAVEFLNARSLCAAGSGGDACRAAALSAYRARLAAARNVLNAALEAAETAYLVCEGFIEQP